MVIDLIFLNPRSRYYGQFATRFYANLWILPSRSANETSGSLQKRLNQIHALGKNF